MYGNLSSCEIDEDGELGLDDKGDVATPESTLNGLSMLGKPSRSCSTETKIKVQLPVCYCSYSTIMQMILDLQ
jgi:hypothetical protein